MKKASLLFVIFIVFILFSGIEAAEFWASKNSSKYHYPSCRWAQKIGSSNLVKFSSPEMAMKAGFVPCKVCKPPSMSKSEDDTLRGTEFSIAKASDDENIARRRGCCSRHGGVCGCQNGRVVCCDGTYSPSCTCAH